MNNTVCPTCESPFPEEGERLALCEGCRLLIAEGGNPPTPPKPLTPDQIVAGDKIFEEFPGGGNG